MTRVFGAAFLAIVLALLIWAGALALLGTSPRWLAQSRHGEQAYGVLVVVASAGLRVFPVLVAAAVLLGAGWLWRRRVAARRTA